MSKLRHFMAGLCVLVLLPLFVLAQYPGQHASALDVKVNVPLRAYSFDLKDVRLQAENGSRYTDRRQF